MVSVTISQDNMRRRKDSIITSYMLQCDEKYINVFGSVWEVTSRTRKYGRIKLCRLSWYFQCWLAQVMSEEL